jgi:hypothetical protein
VQYTVNFQDYKYERAGRRLFASREEADRWAKAFVAESIRDEATASVYEDGNPEPLASWHNVVGRAVKCRKAAISK